MNDVELHAALRAAFPMTFPASASADYVQAWLDLALAPIYEPATATERVGSEGEWLAARRTALGLAGCWALALRGTA